VVGGAVGWAAGGEVGVAPSREESETESVHAVAISEIVIRPAQSWRTPISATVAIA